MVHAVEPAKPALRPRNPEVARSRRRPLTKTLEVYQDSSLTFCCGPRQPGREPAKPVQLRARPPTTEATMFLGISGCRFVSRRTAGKSQIQSGASQENGAFARRWAFCDGCVALLLALAGRIAQHHQSAKRFGFALRAPTPSGTAGLSAQFKQASATASNQM